MSPSDAGRTGPRVLLVCSGLDHAHRGYESFARECFEQLHAEEALRIELVKGSGPNGLDEMSFPTLRRDRRIARALGRALGARPFRIEALAFAASLQPLLTRRRPDLVYMSEWDTARGLALLRRLLGQRFKLLLCNGGFAETGFDHLDHVQELTPVALDHVLAGGADPARHSLLPLGFDIPRDYVPVNADEQQALRAKWELPLERPIVVSLAALNRSHKRLGYLIDELAAVAEPRPFVLLVGEPDDETPELRSYASERLGPNGHRFLTVAAHEVPELLRASDAFVLTSLAEMQGRAVIEAMGEGLPCLVHDSPVMRFAVGEEGLLADFELPGSLTQMLIQGLARATDPESPRRRHYHVYERFGWEALRPRYVQLLTDAAYGRAANRIVSSSAGEKLSR